MKGFMALVILVLLGFGGYNYFQVQALNKQVTALKSQLSAERVSKMQTETALSEATKALAQAREAINNTDTTKARAIIDDAKVKLDSAAKAVGEKSGPALEWVKQQAGEIGRKAREKLGQ